MGTTVAVDTGFLAGNQMFKVLALVFLLEPLIKFISAVSFVNFGWDDFVYGAIPISMISSFLIAYFFSVKVNRKISIKKATFYQSAYINIITDFENNVK